MKRYFIIIAFIFSIFLNIEFINSAIGDSDDEIERSIKYLNDIRSEVGVNELTNSPKLSQAALVHTKYMYYNDIYSSIEESGKLYYRGRYPANRASYFLYEKPYVYELLNNVSKTYENGIINYIYNPYSRTVLFDPVYEDIGMGNFEGFYTFNFGGEKRLRDTQVIYPYNKQKNIPINWTNIYHINPYKQIGFNNGLYGLPITYTYYSDKLKVEKFDINNIKLVNAISGYEVKFKIITPDIDRTLKNTLIILPIEEYNSNVTYNLVINMNINFTNYTSKNVKYEGSFSTGIGNIVVNDNEKLLTRAKCTEEIIKSLQFTLFETFFITFSDIDIKSTSAKYIYTAYVNRIVEGYDNYNTQFKPNRNISKEEVYTMIIRAYERKTNKKIEFSDTVNINDYNEVSIWCSNLNIINKADKLGLLIRDSNNEINPKDYITEKEFNIIINKLLDIVNGN